MNKKTIPNKSRVLLAERHGCTEGTEVIVQCAYCCFLGVIRWFENTRWVQSSDLEFDHVIPRSKGGTSDPENLVFACRKCNRGKKDRDPIEWKLAKNG